jgi:hypothetical protein
MAKSPNRLLASLSSEVFSALAPQLKTVELRFGDVVAEAGATIRRVFCSVLATTDTLKADMCSARADVRVQRKSSCPLYP